MKTVKIGIAVLLAITLLPAAALTETWDCPGCGATLDVEFRFCPYCAHPSVLPEPMPVPKEWFCTNCTRFIDGTFTYCPYCAGTRETTGLKEGEWFCGECQRVNNRGYCGGCGKPQIVAAVTPQPKANSEPIPASTRKPTSAPTPEPISVLEYKLELKAIRDAKVGDYVTYGRYSQTAIGHDQTPIEWIVLDVQGDKMLLLSRYGLDTKSFCENYRNVWESCTLRTWLNGKFLNRAFSEVEQKAILTTNVNNGKEQGYDGWNKSGGNDPKDKVFLLSYAEANQYLGVTYDDKNNTRSRVAPTEYAIKNGAWTNTESKTADGKASGIWWLRSPGSGQNNAAGVSAEGAPIRINTSSVNYVVRPAIRIDIRSDIF